MTQRLVICLIWLAALGGGCAPKAPPAVPSAPRYPEFVQPVAPAGLPLDVTADLQAAWILLQRDSTGAADRLYARALKRSPGMAAAIAGQAYVALARADADKAVARFGAALEAAPSMAAALVGLGQAQLQLSKPADALASFEAAQAADPQLNLASRIETLRFRVVEDTVARARTFAQSKQWQEAKAAYEQALAASPESAVLYRELAVVERQSGLAAEANAHLEQALQLDPSDRAAHVLVGESREESGDIDGAIASYEAASRLEPSAELDGRIARARERDDLSRLPDEFRALREKPDATRADLAAAIALRLPGLLERAPARPMPVLTDVRSHWARPWIVASIRAGVLDAFPNHMFQPSGAITRSDLALATARTLALLAAQGDRTAPQWQAATPMFADLAPDHPSYAAMASAVAAGVVEATDGQAEPTRSVTGQELLEAVSRLQRLAGPLAARDPR